MKEKSILVIDDEPIILDLVRECLLEDFQIIITATNVEAARDHLFSRQFDVILVDIDIRGTNGAEIVKFVGDYDPSGNKETPIMIMSGLINDTFKEKFQDKFAGILAKPFKPGDLQAQVLIALGKSKRRNKNQNLSLTNEESEFVEESRDVNTLAPKNGEKIKVEFEVEDNKFEIDFFNPNVVSPFEIKDLSQKVGVVLNKVKKNNKLSELFKNIKISDKEGYMLKHIELLINISTGISHAMDWGSEQTLEKFVFASYLHDVSLGDAHELAKYKFLKEFDDNPTINDDIKKIIKYHSIASKKLIEHKSDIPVDVHTIIELHHEMPDGSGFPYGFDHKRITPLASIFIVSHLLADYIIENKNWKIKDFVAIYSSKMKGPHFRKALKTLENLK